MNHRRHSIIQDALTAGDAALLMKYRGRELEFFVERGRLYPEKLAELFESIFGLKHQDLVVIGPRGGGKTMGVSDAALALFLFREFDVFQLGGSMEQATKGFNYVRQILYQDKQLADTLQDELKTMATGPRGNWFKVAPSSMKQVRGPHPGDPHPEMNWESHGGLLVKDERDEMDDEIADAADFCMDAADPSIIVTTSTMHRDDGGGIAQMADEAEARGAKVIKFDVFDVCEVCTHDCRTCPGGQAFAGPLFGQARIQNSKFKIQNAPAPGLPVATVESRKQWADYQAQHAWPAGEPGYCEGRAKQHRPGHVKMDKIFRAYKRSRNVEIFEVEMCCRKRRGARKVLDGAKLDACLREDVHYLPGYPAPVGTMDWGFKGWGVPAALQPQADQTIAVIDVRYLHMTGVDQVVEIFKGWREEYGLYKIYADASHPYENAKLRDAGFEVVEVAFAQYKELGAGWLKGLVEREKLRICGKVVRPTRSTVAGVAPKPEYIFYSEDERELHKQCKGWRRDKNGKIVKANDHGPDSLSCAAQEFVDEQPWSPELASTGTRESVRSWQ